MRDGRNGGGDFASTLTRGKLEGWVKVRIAGQTDWKWLRMCVSAGTITSAARSSTNVVPIVSSNPLQIPGHNPQRSSHLAPKKRRISGLFSRDQPNDLPERPTISLYVASWRMGRKRLLLTFETVTQAFAVYPERPNLISSRPLIKLEGTYGDEEMCTSTGCREGWILLVPGGSRKILRWLIGEHAPCAKPS